MENAVNKVRHTISRLKSRYLDERNIPPAAKEQTRLDRAGVLNADPGPAAVAAAGVAWLLRSQAMSSSADGGSARDYSLLKGWASSYPETTGYIVPTLIDYADSSHDREILLSAKRMLDWLVSIQFSGGGFQGGKIDANPRVPVTFNTGQILIGLAAGVRRFGPEYRVPMIRAAKWLVESQDADGCWRKHPTPFAAPGEKSYETHVAWGLFEAAKLEPTSDFGDAGLRQVRWALTKQLSNGWFASNCLETPDAPLTHTIGYALRGVIEAFRFSNDETFLDSARTTADALLDVIDPAGRLPGQLDKYWRPTVRWTCLTGNVQIAACWFLLHKITDKGAYLDAALLTNRFVRKTVHMIGDPDVVGGVRGSFPVYGDYGRYEYLNWATKFAVDAQLLELDLVKTSSLQSPALR